MTDAAEPVHPVWGEPFQGQVLEASGPDPRVVALQQAVRLYRKREPTANADRLNRQVVEAAKEFEAYLTSDKE